jgi:hypothetical protein
MWSKPRVRALLVSVVLALAIASIVALALVPSPVTPKPFMTLRGLGYEIDYYSVSTFNYPVVVFRGFMNGEPVFFTVSLFAMAPNHIYTVGYYSGYGSVVVNLTGSLVRYVASRWVSEFNGALNPSLIAFITYGEGNKSWTVIAAIPYKPSWVVSQEPIEITVNANFTAVRPVIAVPMTKPTGTTQSNSTNGPGSDPFGYTYVSSCIGNPYVAYPPPPPQPPRGAYDYYWVLQQCSEFEGPIPLLFVGWSQNAIQSISGIFIDYMGGGTAQSGSGLFGALNDSGNVVLVGPTYTFSQSYTIETPIGSQVCIVYGPSLTFTPSGTCPNGYGSPIYYVPSSGFFYIGLPGYVAYVTFQEYLNDEPLNNWANGTEPLEPLPSDFSGNYLYVYPYIDVGNGSITGMFTGVLAILQQYGELVVNLYDDYYYQEGLGWSPCGSMGSLDVSPLPYNLEDIEYTLSNVINTYSPNPVGLAYEFGTLIAGAVLEGIPDIPEVLGIGIDSALDVAGMISVPNLVNNNQFSVSANVYIYWQPSSQLYITLIGSPEVTGPSGSQFAYPMGLIVNYSGFYLSNYFVGAQCNK